MTQFTGRTLVVTYCSRDKDPAAGLLPAVDRYLSPRIHAAAEAASRLGFDFMILSGLYGLLAHDHPIPHYDHLLTAEGIPAHVDLVVDQLGTPGPDRVVFISRSLEEDPGCGPYREVMARVCSRVGSNFEWVDIGPGDPDPEILSGII
jgi:hypothetical protein